VECWFKNIRSTLSIGEAGGSKIESCHQRVRSGGCYWWWFAVLLVTSCCGRGGGGGFVNLKKNSVVVFDVVRHHSCL